MAIPARFLRSFLPALLATGLVLAACSSDSDDPPGDGQTDDPPGKGGKGSGGMAGASPEPSDAGSPPLGTGGSDDEPAKGGAPAVDPEPEPGSAGAGGSDDPGPPEPTEGFLRGQALLNTAQCVTCHQADYGGIGLFPNISPDELTGIGSWTDEEISAAIRKGNDPDGGKLCAQMMMFPFSDEEMTDVLEFLRTIPAVSRKITADCQ